MIQKKFAAEIGGTFTDIIFFSSDGDTLTLNTTKITSTPAWPEEAVIEGGDSIVNDWAEVNDILHGSTVATNAVLERKGVKAALLVTEGVADLLEIQRGDKTNIYDLFYQRRDPVIPREFVYTVTERVSAKGDELISVDEAQVREVAASIRQAGITSIGICFLHSYANAAHELKVKSILEESIPGCIVTASCEILPQFREYERASTVAITTYIAPIMVSYIERLYNNLRMRGFEGSIHITQSNGGVIPMRALRKEVARTLLSGPAAGVTGAIFMAKQSGIEDIITLDIGGTSADVCLVNRGRPLITTESKIDNSVIAIPMLDIQTIGAGGGSIAWLDPGGMLHAGPQSAGATPGPACYSRGGTDPTVTDALAYRGFIRPEQFAGGKYPLVIENSRNALSRLAEKMSSDPDNMSEAIIRIMESQTMQAIRLVSTERGYDVRKYTLVAFGGEGGLHAANLAQELGIRRVLIPRFAGILSSFGLLVADIIRDYVQTCVTRCSLAEKADFERQFGMLKENALADMSSYGYSQDNIIFEYSIDARYLGQAFELQIDLDTIPGQGREVADMFHIAHHQRYGSSSPNNEVEVVNYRLRLVIPQDNRLLNDLTYHVETDKDEYMESKILSDGKWQTCRFYSWQRLIKDAIISGPAVVEDITSTCYIPGGWTGYLQHNGSILLESEV